MALRTLTGLNGPDQPHLVPPCKTLPVSTGAHLSSVWDLQAWHELCCWVLVSSSADVWVTFWFDFGHVLTLWTCLSITQSDSDL